MVPRIICVCAAPLVDSVPLWVHMLGIGAILVAVSLVLLIRDGKSALDSSSFYERWQPWLYACWAALFVMGCLAVRYALGCLCFAYIAGYAFAALIPFVPVSALLETMWKQVPRALYPSSTVELQWKGLLLGVVERSLYLTALLIGGPALAFIGAWLALKVAGQWDYWRSARGGKLYDLHLTGMGVSLAYAVVGWQVILWSTGHNCPNALFAAPTLERISSGLGGVWRDVLLGGLPAVLLASVLIAATVGAYLLVGRKGKMRGLAVLFSDGTEKVFEVTYTGPQGGPPGST